MSVDYSIIVPVYGAENSLENLHAALTATFRGKETFEIIYVDDRSVDNSWEVLKKLQAASPGTTKLVRLSRNFGQHGATVCGFKHAQGKLIITIDDDLEVHPDQIQKLVEEQKKTDADLVYGLYRKTDRGLLRSLFTFIYKLAAKFEGPDKGKGSSFRLLKRSLCDKIVGNHVHFIFIDELCLWYTSKVAFVNVSGNPEYVSKKRYQVGGLVRMTGTVVMFSSALPLKFVTYCGFLLSFINFVIGTIYIFKKFYLRIEVHGYTSLIVSILFSTGIIIFCLGILAQYLREALKSVNNAPVYNEDELIC